MSTPAHLDREIAAEREGVADAVLRGEGPRHREADHALRPERLDREPGRHRRVDPAREPHHRTRRQVLLAEVVADPEHQPALELGDRVGIDHSVQRETRIRARQIHHLEARLEVRQRGQHAPARVHREGRAVEDQLVVAAHLVHEHAGHAVARREVGDHAPSLRGLAHVPRRGGEIQHGAGAGPGQLARRVDGIPELVYPDVLADGQAERRAAAAAASRSRAARRAGTSASRRRRRRSAAGSCARDRAARAAREQHRGVHQPLRPRALRREHRAERDRDARRGGRERLQLAQLIAHEAFALEQVHRRIAGEDHLRQDHQIRLLAGRLGGGLLDEQPVAAEVADGGIHLGQRDAHPRSPPQPGR